MDPLIVSLIVIAALVIGAVLGWLASARGIAPLREENARLRSDGERTAGDLRTALDGVRDERDAAQRELAGLKASAEERDRAFEARLTELREAKEALTAQFSEVGAKMLSDAQKQFLERADARFHQAGEKNEERLKQLLSPVGERLKAYEEQVGKIEKDRTEAYGTLTGLIDQMRVGQEGVRSETEKLVNSLRNAPKARGRWGEQQLRNVLETAGLAEHTDFRTEVSVESEDGRMRPDAIIRVPGGRALVIDAKVSLNDYQDAFNADEEEAREIALARHCTSMKTHIEGLSRKAYWSQFDEAPDYVIMFVPGEHFLTAALEHEPSLWDHAFDKKVLLATPTNLIAIARTVAAVWRQEGLAQEAKQIGQLGKEMYDRLAVAAGHMRTVGSGLTTAVNNYNKFVGSFERNVLSTGRRFAELNIETGKNEIGELQPVEAIAREPNAGSLPSSDNDEDTPDAAE
ncbi:DNA recombination protein RmuC [Parasphingopyxis algicola]|uniref:DNA recombination protein RmuC n=1 Tax=Parasphingopyxis algicola TaxID=2026624 RepID=UPI0015A2C573|nr:DNA recombination protein RmuC [Parasphingopyxis algicola]QLC24105.1 DNA recombination protein RmuC [Parasphingopyxis algicola]